VQPLIAGFPNARAPEGRHRPPPGDSVNALPLPRLYDPEAQTAAYRWHLDPADPAQAPPPGFDPLHVMGAVDVPIPLVLSPQGWSAPGPAARRVPPSVRVRGRLRRLAARPGDPRGAAGRQDLPALVGCSD